MDNTNIDSLTSFPNLTSCHERLERLNTRDQICLDTTRISESTIVVAWALLLQAYTTHSRVSFQVNKRYVLVETDSRNVEYSETSKHLQGCLERCLYPTRVCFVNQESLRNGESKCLVSPEADGTRFALSLECDLDRGNCLLHTTEVVPKIHVHQITLQFAHFLAYVDSQDIGDARDPHDDILQLSAINVVPEVVPGPKLLHELVFQNSHPSDLAVDFKSSDGGRKYTSFAELDNLSNALASRISRILNAQNASKHGLLVVPVLLPQSTELYIAHVAILKAGAAFCPISEDAPEERVKFIVEDTSAKVVVTSPEHQHKVPLSASTCILNFGYEDVELNHVFRPVRGDDIAYIMYSKWRYCPCDSACY